MYVIHEFALFLVTALFSILQPTVLGHQPKYTLGEKHHVERGEKYLKLIDKYQKQEKLLDVIFGKSCYTEAMRRIQRDCRDLSPEDNSRLALLLMYCQQIVQGEDRSNARLKCGNDELLKSCIGRLTERENAMYIEFLTHVDSICMFLQNQGFEKYAESVLNNLVTESSSALTKISTLHSGLESLTRDLINQKNLQQKFHTNMTQSVELMRRMHLDLNIQQKNLQVTAMKQYSESTEAVYESTRRLEALVESATENLREAIRDFRKEADATAAIQREIKEDIQGISNYTSSLGTFFESVHEYHKKSEHLLLKILGSNYSTSDGFFYGFGAIFLLGSSIIGVSMSIRLYLIVWMVVCLFLERFFASFSGIGLMMGLTTVKSLIRKGVGLILVVGFLSSFLKKLNERKCIRTSSWKFRGDLGSNHLPRARIGKPMRMAFSEDVNMLFGSHSTDLLDEMQSKRTKSIPKRTLRERKSRNS